MDQASAVPGLLVGEIRLVYAAPAGLGKITPACFGEIEGQLAGEEGGAVIASRVADAQQLPAEVHQFARACDPRVIGKRALEHGGTGARQAYDGDRARAGRLAGGGAGARVATCSQRRCRASCSRAASAAA